MDEPIWMDATDAVVAHDLEISVHGVSSAVRDVGLLDSALARPRNLFANAESPPTLVRRAAAYAFGISSNHPFVDGNQRTALMVSFAFLDPNGIEVIASQEDAYRAFLARGAGEIDELQLAEWLAQNTGPLVR